MLVSLERCGLLRGNNLIDRILQGEVDAHRRGLGPLTLLLHRLLKAGQINLEPLLLGDFLGEL